MDFMKILRSLEELLYEVMTWLVFYPRTVVLTLFWPVRTLEYSRLEYDRPTDERYDRTLSPPLFLLLSLLLSHLLELVLHFSTPEMEASPLSRLSDQNLVIVRSLFFAVFPLMFALHQVKAIGLPLSRTSLRGPFFVECYPAAVFALMLQVGMTTAGAVPNAQVPGGLLAAGAVVWYLGVQTLWISRVDRRRWRAFAVALWQWLKAATVLVAVAIAIQYLARPD